MVTLKLIQLTWGRFYKKSQFETSFGRSLGLKSETFVSAEFLAQMDFTKGGSAETAWSQVIVSTFKFHLRHFLGLFFMQVHLFHGQYRFKLH